MRAEPNDGPLVDGIVKQLVRGRGEDARGFDMKKPCKGSYRFFCFQGLARGRGLVSRLDWMRYGNAE
jgi:hypothetical protein